MMKVDLLDLLVLLLLNNPCHVCIQTSLAREATYNAVSGVCSAGFNTIVQPEAKAGAHFHDNIAMG